VTRNLSTRSNPVMSDEHGPRLRVAHVAAHFDGGVATVVRDHSERLRAAGHHVLLISAGDAQELSMKDVSSLTAVGGLGRLPAAFLTATARVAKALRSFRPDVVHSHAPATAIVAALAARIAPGHPAHVATVHGLVTDAMRASIACFRISRATLVGCAPSVSQQLVAGGVRPDRVVTISNGVALAPAEPDRVAAMRTRLGLPGGPIVLGLGRLADQKDWETFIAAVDQIPNATGAIVGDGPMRGQLHALIEARGSSVRLPGSVDDVAAVLGSATMLLMTSRYEGLPMTGIEAMSLGVPIVAVDIPGLRDVAPDGAVSWVPSRDPSAIAATVRDLLDDPQARRAMSLSGRSGAPSWSPSVMSDAYLSLYRYTLAGRAG
jgi:glycosyltransferase involved in cell wall biosynthesis